MSTLVNAIGVFWRPRITFGAVPKRRATVGLLALVVLLSALIPIGMASTERGRGIAVQRRVEARQQSGRPMSTAEYSRVQSSVVIDSVYGAGFLSLSRLLGIVLLAAVVAILAVLAGEKQLGFGNALFITTSAGLITVAGDMITHAASYLAGAAVSPGSGSGIAAAIGAPPAVHAVLGVIDVFSLWWLAVLLTGIRRQSTGRVVSSLVGAAYAIALAGIVALRLFAQP